MNDRIGVIGLGVMGSGMAANLVRSGFSVSGFDVSPERLSDLTDLGGTPSSSAGAVARNSEFLILSLPTPESLLSVVDEIAPLASEGSLVLETGTFSIEAKREAFEVLARVGIELMDTPLSGTGLQAADGSLVVLASGSRDGYQRAGPVFNAIGKQSHYLGAFGNGSKVKYVANLLVAVHNLAAAEAMALAAAAGLDPLDVLNVLQGSVASSRILEIRGPKMVDGDYTPTVRLDLMVKDTAVIKAFAEQVNANTPLLDASAPLYVEASRAGLGSLDPAALFSYLVAGGTASTSSEGREVGE